MSVRAAVATLAACLLLAGCAALRGPAETVGAVSEAPPRNLIEYGAHLHGMDRTALGRALERAHEGWENDPSARNRARLGLVRAEPGHPGHAPGAAVDDLASALSGSDNPELDEIDRAYLEFRMAQLRQQLAAQARAEKLRRETERLREQLREAREKLRALADIETRINTEDTR